MIWLRARKYFLENQKASKYCLTTKNEVDNYLPRFLLLSYLDSNQDKQNQNLLCYHYTIGQSSMLSFEERCKGITFSLKSKIFHSVFA